MMRQFTPEENLRLEWDGAPHRLDGSSATPEQDAAIHNGEFFVGLDNDRTMVRIGWMNLVLHGLENPHIFQGDSLSQLQGKSDLARLLRPEAYDAVLANPPFTGTVDSNDIDTDSLRFPRAKGKGKGAARAQTDKSELLFCWLMLDLLDVGGRCAVIVPEGVLFGNTDAHVRLRRELLTEHVVEAVISLPGGVFQPYTGVKTSILVFRKETRRDDKKEFKGQSPKTDHVFFYEVSEDGYSLDAKRREQPNGRNDLWDALEKFKAWQKRTLQDDGSYYQPAVHRERWRLVQIRDSEDKLTPLGEAFGDKQEVNDWEGRVAAIHELFPDLPVDPKEATQYIEKTQSFPGGFSFFADLTHAYLALPAQSVWEKWQKNSKGYDTEAALGEWDKAVGKARSELTAACREAYRFFEKEDSLGLPLWKHVVAQAIDIQIEQFRTRFVENKYPILVTIPDLAGDPVAAVAASRYPRYTLHELQVEVDKLAREYAKLDGFDVTLRGLGVQPTEASLKTAKHWIVPVRRLARNEEWVSPDGKQGSHDAAGNPRPEYLRYLEIEGLYEAGKLKDDLLDPDCIEAREWNLSAGQYKPFDFAQLRSEKSVAELIEALREVEMQIIEGLDKLKAMVEGRE